MNSGIGGEEGAHGGDVHRTKGCSRTEASAGGGRGVEHADVQGCCVLVKTPSTTQFIAGWRHQNSQLSEERGLPLQVVEGLACAAHEGSGGR